MPEDLLIVSSALVFKRIKRGRSSRRWFIVKQSEDAGWELPRTIARRGESSVRAVTRMMADQGGMNIVVLEEAGRAGGVARVNNKAKKQRHLFYLILFKNGREVLGFEDAAWLEYADAARKLSNKRDQLMLRAANKLVKTVELPKAEKPEDAELEV